LGLKNQLMGFSTMVLYQYIVLASVSRLAKVNLNFTLCHSHADPGYDLFGYGYFFAAVIYLNIFSYVTRLIMYPARVIFNMVFLRKKETLK
jgi:hypothetical protein